MFKRDAETLAKVENHIMILARERAEFIRQKESLYPDGHPPRSLCSEISKRTTKMRRLQVLARELINAK